LFGVRESRPGLHTSNINIDPFKRKYIHLTWGSAKLIVDVAGAELGPEASSEYGWTVPLLVLAERP